MCNVNKSHKKVNEQCSATTHTPLCFEVIRRNTMHTQWVTTFSEDLPLSWVLLSDNILRKVDYPIIPV